jgi:predicted RecA/RadA family phage recombinase
VKNFIQPGNYGLTVIAPTGGVTSGQITIVGAIVGVAATTQPAGAEVEIACEGVYDLAKNPPDALVAGAVAKVTVTNGIGVVAAGTAAVGWVVQAAAAGATTTRVRLVPSIAGTPTVLEAAQEHHHRKVA